MPTKDERIPMTKDAELGAALEQVAPLVDPGTKTANLVRELALRGAEALIAEHREGEEAIERLVARSAAEDPGFDREVLADADIEAWQTPPDA